MRIQQHAQVTKPALIATLLCMAGITHSTVCKVGNSLPYCHHFMSFSPAPPVAPNVLSVIETKYSCCVSSSAFNFLVVRLWFFID